MRPNLVILGALALLAGCQGGPEQAPVTSSAPGPHDGRYSGPISVTRGGANCAGGGQIRTLDVAGGRGRILYSPANAATATGTVSEVGAVQLSDPSRGVTITGQIRGNAFNGQFVSRDCTFRFDFTKT